jgi:hypothetical protein
MLDIIIIIFVVYIVLLYVTLLSNILHMPLFFINHYTVSEKFVIFSC